jgi:dTDP-glucose pyrophosphorylase
MDKPHLGARVELHSIEQKRWESSVIPDDSSVEQVILNLEQTALKVALVTNSEGQFVGIVTDGDIRRAFIGGAQLDSPVTKIMNSTAFVGHRQNTTHEVLALMEAHKIEHLPIIDDHNALIGLYVVGIRAKQQSRHNRVVIMAGGQGLRLRPLTENRPKPMISIGGKPILEHIVTRFREQGFSDFTISINYLGESIKNYFANGVNLGVSIDYIEEDTPLGTAGSLRKLKRTNDLPFVVTNGDVISDIDYGDLLDFHCEQEAWATMAIRPFQLQNPFGVVETEGISITGIREKPVTRTHINTGVYVFDPRVVQSLPSSEFCQIPELFDHLREEGHRTIAFHLQDEWIDVGNIEDLARAENKFTDLETD